MNKSRAPVRSTVLSPSRQTRAGACTLGANARADPEVQTKSATLLLARNPRCLEDVVDVVRGSRFELAGSESSNDVEICGGEEAGATAWRVRYQTAESSRFSRSQRAASAAWASSTTTLFPAA